MRPKKKIEKSEKTKKPMEKPKLKLHMAPMKKISVVPQFSDSDSGSGSARDPSPPTSDSEEERKTVQAKKTEEAKKKIEGLKKKKTEEAKKKIEEEAKKKTEEAKKNTEEENTEEEQKSKKRRRNFGLILTEQQETDMGEWLYLKTMKEYKDIAKKNQLWAEKAVELNLESGKLLKTWYDSIRTRVGKLNSTKSGSAAKSKTDRDVFIEQTFGFLASNICRRKGRTAVSLSQAQSSQPEAQSSGSEMEMEEQQEEEVEGLSPQGTSTPDVPTLQKGGRGKVKGVSKRMAIQPMEEDDVLVHLRAQQQQASHMRGEIQTILNSEKQSTTQAWGNWMAAMADEVDPNLRPQLYRQSLEMMLGFQESSKTQQPQPNQPKPPRQQQQHQQQQQQHQTVNYYDLAVPDQQQNWHHVAGPWETAQPTAGQNTPEPVYQQQEQPPRSNSMPNIATSIGNISGLSDLLPDQWTMNNDPVWMCDSMNVSVLINMLFTQNILCSSFI